MVTAGLPAFAVAAAAAGGLTAMQPQPPGGPAAPPKVQRLLWVFNASRVSGISSQSGSNLVSLFQTAQGVVNRVDPSNRVMLVGLSADILKGDGSDAAALSLGFLKERYGDHLAYDASRDFSGEDPWKLFGLPFVRAAVTHVVEVGSADAPQALYAALTVASIHGRAAVLHASPSERREVLARTGLQPISSVVGVLPGSSNSSCADANTFVAQQLHSHQESSSGGGGGSGSGGGSGGSNLSNAIFSTWGHNVMGKPTQGFDFTLYKRMLAFCMDSGADDWATTQRRILAFFPTRGEPGQPLPFG